MECPFVIGQTVICIEEAHPYPTVICPEVGKDYVIRDITTEGWDIGLLFVEIRNPRVEHLNVPGKKSETSFWWRQFRPAVDLLAEFLAARTRQKPRQKTNENV